MGALPFPFTGSRVLKSVETDREQGQSIRRGSEAAALGGSGRPASTMHSVIYS